MDNDIQERDPFEAGVESMRILDEITYKLVHSEKALSVISVLELLIVVKICSSLPQYF